MRTVAFALLTSLGLLASEPALAGKSFAGTVGKAVPSGAQASAPAPVHRGHRHHHRVFVGGAVGFGYPWGWWGPPAYYYPVPVPAEPVTYLEQSDADQPERWWYYCDASTSYYPYVRECPAGWERVAPR